MTRCYCRPLLSALLLILLMFPFASHAGLALDLQASIRGSAFEVVQKKPAKDPLTYEKALPFDLVPFLERNDSYRSIGTAFALGQNRYVSAAHVFALAMDSQFGEPALRSANGAVYPVDRILKYSDHGDFVVFSIRNDPSPKGLQVNRAPKIDTAVFAAGNALGQGIVIRDGVFTSETPEEQDGLWKWIRFSAAASPGNSGGPLLDEAGNVVGIVLRKSANENLNYSLPISIVLDAPSDKAIFNDRELTSLPFMRGTRTYTLRDEFPLPLTWPEFVKAHDALTGRHFDASLAELTEAYADTQFTRGVGVDSIMYSRDTNYYDPRLITQQKDHTWSAEALDCCTTNLAEDGFLTVGWIDDVALLRLHRSGYASDDGFYADSNALMDVVLKGLELTRNVGGDEIRITSLGSARTELTYIDHFGRIWQQRVWALPYRDAYVVGFLLPTPEGYSGMAQISSSAKLRETETILQRMTDQFAVSYVGAPAQWRAFLKRVALLPKVLSRVTLAPKPEWELSTPRFETRILSRVFPLNDQGQIGVINGYVQEGPRLVLDVVGVEWAQDPEEKSTVGVARIARPPKTAKLDLRSTFNDVAARRPPFDGQLLRDKADGYVMSQIVNVPGTQKGKASSDLLYEITVRLSGANAIRDINELLSLVVSGTHILEHGIGPDTEPFQQAPVKTERITAGLSMADLAVVANGSEDAIYGQDIRGRMMSEDFRDYVLSGKTSEKTASRDKLDPAQAAKRAAALFDYWAIAPGVIHNRDLWSSFLEHNRLPSAAGHRLSVTEAQAQLVRTLDDGEPGPEWAQRAQNLIDAYVKERVDIAKSRAAEFPAQYSARTTPCPKAAEQKSNTETPNIAPLTRSPEEFYPNAARRAQIQGSVVVAVQVDTTGCGRQRGIVTSSGSDDIDQAALEFIDTAEFFPAQRQGNPVEGIYKTLVRFKIRD